MSGQQSEKNGSSPQILAAFRAAGHVSQEQEGSVRPSLPSGIEISCARTCREYCGQDHL